MLSSVEQINDSKIIQAENFIIEKLMIDEQIDETQAADLFYNSKTFEKLADESAELYRNPWQDLYEMLKKE